MTELSYDVLFDRYENAKQLIADISDAFAVSFDSLQSSLHKYGDDSNREFTEELSSLLRTAKSNLEPLFAHKEDPGLFTPTKLQQQMNFPTES